MLRYLLGCFLCVALTGTGEVYGTVEPDSLRKRDHAFFQRLPYRTDIQKNLDYATGLYKTHGEIGEKLFIRIIRILKHTGNDPYLALAHRRYGEALQKRGEQDEALEQFRLYFEALGGSLKEDSEAFFDTICEAEIKAEHYLELGQWLQDLERSLDGEAYESLVRRLKYYQAVCLIKQESGRDEAVRAYGLLMQVASVGQGDRLEGEARMLLGALNFEGFDVKSTFSERSLAEGPRARNVLSVLALLVSTSAIICLLYLVRKRNQNGEGKG